MNSTLFQSIFHLILVLMSVEMRHSVLVNMAVPIRIVVGEFAAQLAEITLFCNLPVVS